MSPRTTGILLLVAAALAAFVYLYEMKGGEQRADAEAKSKELFPGVEQAAITAVELATKEGESVRLERRDGRWLLVSPLEFPADAFAVDGIAGNLAGLASEAVLEDPQPPAEYGLGDGARVVRFSVGDAEHALRLGRKTPVGSNSYASVEGSDKIVTIATYKAQSFEKSLTDLRERRILDFDKQAIEKVELRWPDGGVTLVRTAAGGAAEAGGEAGKPEGGEDAAGDGEAAEPAAGSRWRVTAPLEGRADDETVDGLLSDLSFLRADGFVDAPTAEQLAGFESPAFEAVLHGAPGEGGEARSWRFALGPVHEGDKRLVRGAQASLYTVSADRASDFPRDVVAYRFKQLAKFAVSDAARVDLFFQPSKGDPVAVSATRGDDGWSSAPEKMTPEKISELVSELANLEAGDIVSESASEADLARLGLSPPRTILTVFGEAHESDPDAAETEGEEAAAPPLPRLAEIQIGNVEGSEWIIARAAGDPAVYRLEYELAEHVPVSLDAFRNRFAVAAGEPDADAPPPSPGGAAGEFLPPSEESP
jgi:hypothetical protein